MLPLGWNELENAVDSTRVTYVNSITNTKQCNNGVEPKARLAFQRPSGTTQEKKSQAGIV